MGPCLTRCFKDVEALLSSSRNCFAALVLSKITSRGRDLEVEPEVEGRVSGDNRVKAGSLGNKEAHLVNAYEHAFPKQKH